MNLSQSLLDSMESRIKASSLLQQGSPAVVAASGGKDSTILLLALRELGYQVCPVVVDMGYATNWGAMVHAVLTDLGFSPLVLRPDVHADLANLAPEDWQAVQKSLGELRSMTPLAAVTPCTRCYNVKAATLLSAAASIGASSVCFGHHRTDALSSLLKSALFYIDRWDRGHTSFVRKNFLQLVRDAASSVTSQGTESWLVARTHELLSAHKAGTDEPPKQHMQLAKLRATICRPLFDIDERVLEIAAQGISTQASGCGHSLLAETRTPRELVHWDLVRAAEITPNGARAIVAITSMLEQSIAPDGTVETSVRNRRHELLGPSYKGETTKF